MATQGFTTDKFAGVRDVLDAQLASGADVGASVAVHHRGEVVVDIWGGWADKSQTVAWEADTLVNVWSTTKTMTFLVALMLADRGELDFHAPVARYWPEFAANGKEAIEVRHLMSHSAGLPGWTEPLPPEGLADWELCTSRLAAQAPWWEPGTASGYHAVSQGYLIGEVVRRITGITIGAFFASEVAGPLGADFFIGLPESEESRVSLVITPPPMDITGIDADSIMARTFISSNLDASSPHNRWWRGSEIPAANGHGNARSVALIQSVVAGRGETHGVRLLSEAGVDRIFDEQISGTDLVLAIPARFGMGYGLSTDVMPLGDRACFWGGYGGSVIIMDQESELTVAYMMNKMESGLVGDMRGATIALTAAMAAAS